MAPHPVYQRDAERGAFQPPLSQPRRDFDNGHGRAGSQRRSPRDDYRRYSPPSERRTSPQDDPRTPPRGPAREGRENRRDWGARRDREYDYNDRDDYRSSSGHDRCGYRDRDREGYRSPRYDSGSRSRSRSRSPSRRGHSPYYGGPQSREVIFEGLPVDMTEDDIRNELESYHNVDTLEDVRVIRDKRTGVSRQFGFLRFADVQGSTKFLEKNYPTVYLYGNGASSENEQGAKVRIAFSRERDGRERPPAADAEWKCRNCSLPNYSRRTECFRCQTPRTEITATGHLTHNKPSHFMNTGDSDASPDSMPSQYLLVRGLEHTVTEELLAKGIAKLYKPSERASPSANGFSKKPGPKVISTTSSANLGAQEGSIRRVFVVKDRRTNESWRYGFAEFHTVEDAQAALVKFNAADKFTISSKPVIVSFIHAGVFVPAATGAETFTFAATNNPLLKLAYWDEEAYVSELMISETAPEAPTSLTKIASGSAAPLAEKEGFLPVGNDTELKSKKRKVDAAAPPSNKKSMPSHLQFWSNRHAELHGLESAENSSNDADVPQKAPKAKEPVQEASASPPATQSFADLAKKCCYLCSRQFKTEAEVNKHERLSQLHQDNLKNEELKAKALVKLGKATTVTASAAAAAAAAASSSETPEYRDRARERRAAFNQPKQPGAGVRKSAATAAKAASEPAKEDSPPAVVSKGASLLGKMGWSAGEGLGAKGTGMVAPLATELYVQGVGLGAQGGKVGDAAEEASRNTKGDYAAFLERTRDKAKERYEKMA